MVKFSTSRTAQILDISTETLKRWYRWYENEDYEKPEGLSLPQYTTDNRGTKFFNDEDIILLEQFKNDLQGKYKGCMSVFNASHQWGVRGKEILKRKEEKDGGDSNNDDRID